MTATDISAEPVAIDVVDKLEEAKRIVPTMIASGYEFFEWQGCAALRHYLGFASLMADFAYGLENEEDLRAALCWLNDDCVEYSAIYSEEDATRCTVVWFRDVPWSELKELVAKHERIKFARIEHERIESRTES